MDLIISVLLILNNFFKNQRLVKDLNKSIRSQQILQTFSIQLDPSKKKMGNIMIPYTEGQSLKVSLVKLNQSSSHRFMGDTIIKWQV